MMSRSWIVIAAIAWAIPRRCPRESFLKFTTDADSESGFEEKNTHTKSTERQDHP
jgi:hypothetical protein